MVRSGFADDAVGEKAVDVGRLVADAGEALAGRDGQAHAARRDKEAHRGTSDGLALHGVDPSSTETRRPTAEKVEMFLAPQLSRTVNPKSINRLSHLNTETSDLGNESRTKRLTSGCSWPKVWLTTC